MPYTLQHILSGCCAQAYDGAAGVAKQIQLEEPKALFVHCFAHSVNLCVENNPIGDALSLVNIITLGLAKTLKSDFTKFTINKTTVLLERYSY